MKTQRPEEYLKDPVNAGRIIHRLLSQKYGELKKAPGAAERCLSASVSSAIRGERLDEALVEQMEFIDLLALIHAIKLDEEYGGTYLDSSEHYGNDEQCLYCICHMMFFLINARKQNTVIDQFLALPVKAFYDALEREVNTKELKAEYQIMRKKCEDELGLADRFDTISIGDLLGVCEEKVKKVWVPSCYEPQEFADRIRGVYRLAGRLLINPFLIVRPERFRMDDMRDKYALKDDGTDEDMLYDLPEDGEDDAIGVKK
ncbi:MAG: hypothetical protein K6B72_09210 [Lachnospiraceae bacterium]|nr:hypothetical protein [Lachnospiraceae bacterium]